MPVSLITRTAKLLGQSRNAVPILKSTRSTRNEQASPPLPKDDEVSTSVYPAKSPLRSLIKTKFATLKGHFTIKQDPGQGAAQNKDDESKSPSILSKIVNTYSTAKAAVARSQKRRLIKKNRSCHQANASIICADRRNTPSRPVQYRDIDLGPYREVIYIDTIVHLNENDSISEFRFDWTACTSPFPGHYEDSHDEVFSGAAIDGLAGPLYDHLTLALLHEASLPASTIGSEAQENLSRPTTSSTDRRGSGEFLRRLQTGGSSVAPRLHSRQISDASAITLPSMTDGDFLGKQPVGEAPLMNEDMLKSEAGRWRFSHISAVGESGRDGGVGQVRGELVDQSGKFEDIMWLQGGDPVEFDSWEVDVVQKSTLLGAEEQVEESRRMSREDGKVCVSHKSLKSSFLHVEQPALDLDQGSSARTPIDPDVITRGYGKFDAAFTQQVKDYSKLLDDLADPDATAQALELVSSRLSVYLNSTSSADVGRGRPARSESPEKRQLKAFSGLDAFLDDEDEDSDFRVERSTEFFACPPMPRCTPFSDLSQFIGDDDIDLNLGMGTSGLAKPTIHQFSDWDLFGEDDEAGSGAIQQDGAMDEDALIAAG